MLFQIIDVGRCFAIDLNKIDLIQMEDSDEMGTPDRYNICFYTIGMDGPKASYNITKMKLEQQMELFSVLCEAKNKLMYNLTHEPEKYIYLIS
jgi:hypothetical protein